MPLWIWLRIYACIYIYVDLVSLYNIHVYKKLSQIFLLLVLVLCKFVTVISPYRFAEACTYVHVRTRSYVEICLSSCFHGVHT